MRIRSVRASIPLVGEVQNAFRIKRASLHYISAKSNTYVLVGTPAQNRVKNHRC